MRVQITSEFRQRRRHFWQRSCTYGEWRCQQRCCFSVTNREILFSCNLCFYLNYTRMTIIKKILNNNYRKNNNKIIILIIILIKTMIIILFVIITWRPTWCFASNDTRRRRAKRHRCAGRTPQPRKCGCVYTPTTTCGKKYKKAKKKKKKLNKHKKNSQTQHTCCRGLMHTHTCTHTYAGTHVYTHTTIRD